MNSHDNSKQAKFSSGGNFRKGGKSWYTPHPTAKFLDSNQGLFQQFITCNNCMQSPALFQNVFKFCTFCTNF